MQRDMDLIRRITLAVHQSDKPVASLEGVGRDVFAQHVQLMSEAGLVYAALQPNDMRPATTAVIWRLTWAGHEFADAIMDDTIWNKAKENVIKPAASWTFGILVEYLKVQINHSIGLN